MSYPLNDGVVSPIISHLFSVPTISKHRSSIGAVVSNWGLGLRLLQVRIHGRPQSAQILPHVYSGKSRQVSVELCASVHVF